MPLIFARFIFAAVTALGPGPGLPWPAMTPTAISGITQQETVEDVLDAEGNLIRTVGIKHLCLAEPGVYQVTARIGLLPLPAGSPDVHGQVWLRGGPDGGVLLTPLFAATGHWSVQGASHVLVVPAPACYRLIYDLTGPATVNPDPRATYVAIFRLGWH